MGFVIFNGLRTLVKVFRINPEYRILRPTFHRKYVRKKVRIAFICLYANNIPDSQLDNH